MSRQKNEPSIETGKPDVDPNLRRGVSRRGLLTGELSRASREVVQRLPSLGGPLGSLFGAVVRESPAQRDERLVGNLWVLLTGHEPKPEEKAAALEVLQNARTPDDKGDSLVDVAWALCQTKDFEELRRPEPILIRGLYRIAVDRDPTDAEREAALGILKEAIEPGARVAAIEGLLTGLLRSAGSVFRKPH